MTRKEWNKMMHYKNRYRRMMQQKKHLKVLQLNKGSSNIDKHKIVIKNNILRSQADIIVLSEAQVGKDPNTLDTDYPEYNVELKFMYRADISHF